MLKKNAGMTKIQKIALSKRHSRQFPIPYFAVLWMHYAANLADTWVLTYPG